MDEAKFKRNRLVTMILTVVLGINLVITAVLLGFQIKTNMDKQAETTKYTLYIGTNDKDTYKNEIPYETCKEKVTEICVKYTGGCTLFDANGYWKDEKENITKELTIGCTLEDIEKKTVYTICDEIIIALNQNSILIETNNVTSLFYSTSNN